MNNNIKFIVRNLNKTFRTGNVEVQALRGMEFTVSKGKFISIVGPSGCGKSTLLYIIGGMLKASAGSVIMDGFEVTSASEKQLTDYRKNQIGFVFQKYNLVSSLNVYQNLKIAADIIGKNTGAVERIDSVLEEVGLFSKRKAKPLELSQGEQQRVAIARALVKRPGVLLADEPTGNLDSKNSENIIRLFRQLSDEHGQTILMITHNPVLAAATDRIIEMKDGRAVSQDENSFHLPTVENMN